MKSIKNIALAAMVTIGAFSAVTYTSCTKDECKDVVCNNGGTCNAGTCTCPTGYEGTTCQNQASEKFKGTWSVTETCGGVNSTPYQVIITASSPTALEINNLGNYNCTIGGNIVWKGLANGGATFTINDNSCSTQMVATGTMNSNGTITVTYTATYGATTDNCTATLSK